MGQSPNITTDQIEALVRGINELYARRMKLDRSRGEEWRAARDGAIRRLHGIVKPSARPYAGAMLAGLAQTLLADLSAAYSNLADQEILARQVADFSQRHAEATAEVATLRRQLDQAQAELAQRPAATAVIMPAQKISVESPIQREVLRLVAVEGLGRVWRIVARVLGRGLTGNENSVRNGIARLAERGLLEDYRQHGKVVTWALKPGGSRRLVALTDTGRAWCRAAFAQEPVESEIAIVARRHKSVSHGVAILEAAHHLRAAGLVVDDDPQAMLAGGERWGPRAEPDLVVILDGEPWPVEVQRETSERLLDKWRKALALTGRLALVLYSEEALGREAAILRSAARQLPAGLIRLASLEAMEGGGWRWEEISTHGSKDERR